MFMSISCRCDFNDLTVISVYIYFFLDLNSPRRPVQSYTSFYIEVPHLTQSLNVIVEGLQ